MEKRTLHFETRAQAGEERQITGIAVPFDTPTQIWGNTFEKVARGAVDTNKNDVKLFWQHSEPIGRVNQLTETPDGLQIQAQLSDTTQGRDAWQLVKDGVINRFSIGFIPLETSEERNGDNVTFTRQKIDLMEVSLVAFPAYEDTPLTDFRSKETTTTEKEKTKMENSTNAQIEELAADVAATRESLDTLTRRFETMDETPAAPAVENRSLGQLLKAAFNGDTAAERALNPQQRDFTGTAIADVNGQNHPAWVGDFTRIIDTQNPLGNLFATAPLPAEGTKIEYGVLKTNTVKVAQQAKEGDNLAFGKVTVDSNFADVVTFGGYTEISRKAIDRAPAALVNQHFKAMTIAAGVAAGDYFAQQFASVVKTNSANNAISTSTDVKEMNWATLSSIMIDAAVKFQQNALALDGLIVLPEVFKALAAMTGTDGRPLMLAAGSGVNTVGTLNITGIHGQLVGIQVYPDLKAVKGTTYGTGVAGAFFNSEAMRIYKSPTVSLQDSNVVNLTNDFSIYFYEAVANELPEGIVPLKTGGLA